MQLDAEAKWKAKANLLDKLEQLIGRTPRGLTLADLEECWREALIAWNSRGEGK